MKSFTVHFHSEDQVQDMQVDKLTEDDFNLATAGGTRHLFELDTNVGFFVYFDAVDSEGKESYLVLQYEEDNEDASACYSFSIQDFYEFSALYLNDLDFDETEDDEDSYGPLHHLAHLMFHIVEEGKTVEV